ncbi:MAG: hypothetical protein HOV66_07670 [Streptomycetaceae bacterium]|nr:hypothetical protein [Streptomycetaceae bacterium]
MEPLTVTRNASSRVTTRRDASSPLFPQVMTRVTRVSDMTETPSMTRVTGIPWFDAYRTRVKTFNLGSRVTRHTRHQAATR